MQFRTRRDSEVIKIDSFFAVMVEQQSFLGMDNRWPVFTSFNLVHILIKMIDLMHT